MDGVKKFASLGMVPKGAERNLEFCNKDITYPKNLAREDILVLSDPQTSGGLLIALPPKGLKVFARTAKREQMPYWIIGEAVKGKGKIIIK